MWIVVSLRREVLPASAHKPAFAKVTTRLDFWDDAASTYRSVCFRGSRISNPPPRDSHPNSRNVTIGDRASGVPRLPNAERAQPPLISGNSPDYPSRFLVAVRGV